MKQGLGRWNGLSNCACTAFILRNMELQKRTQKMSQFTPYQPKTLSNHYLASRLKAIICVTLLYPTFSTLHFPPSIIHLEQSSLSFLRRVGFGQLQIDLQPNIIRIPFGHMRDLMDSDSDHQPVSPTVFLADLSPVQLHLETMPKLALSQVERCSMEEGTFQSEKSTRKKMAGAKSRQKKKRHLQELQESVRHLAAEVQSYEDSISRCKSELVEALRTAASAASEHSYTYAELERATRIQADLDRVNLLLDLIQNRIGANARERQARLDYNFKQIINSLFPAMHRYLMHSALHCRDVFAEDQNENNSWTVSFYEELQLTPIQRKGFTDRQEAFIHQRRETVGLIGKLKSVKEQLKAQEEIFERAMTHIRQQMNPLQSARLILFGENNKLRKQFSLFCDQFTYQQPSKLLKTE